MSTRCQICGGGANWIGGRNCTNGGNGGFGCRTAREAALRNIDFTSWQSVVTTIVGLALVTLIGIGIRLIAQTTIQQRRERMNRQINERLRTLIAAYKVLGGSFTGNLAVDPTHLREWHQRQESEDETGAEPASDRPRRIRDAVEAALSDIILLGTAEQVRLAGQAARELVAGRPVETQALVVALRDFIREALDLDPIPADFGIPSQGPTRPSGVAKGKGGGDRGGEGGGRQGGGGGMGGGGMGGGGTGAGMGGISPDPNDPTVPQHPGKA